MGATDGKLVGAGVGFRVGYGVGGAGVGFGVGGTVTAALTGIARLPSNSSSLMSSASILRHQAADSPGACVLPFGQSSHCQAFVFLVYLPRGHNSHLKLTPDHAVLRPYFPNPHSSPSDSSVSPFAMYAFVGYWVGSAVGETVGMDFIARKYDLASMQNFRSPFGCIFPCAHVPHDVELSFKELNLPMAHLRHSQVHCLSSHDL